MNTVTDQAVAHVLRGAKHAISNRGWGQGASEGPDGQICFDGALTFAVLGVPQPDRDLVAPDEYDLLNAARNVIDRTLDERHGDLSWLVEWNDALGRTVDEVLALLDEAITLVSPAGTGGAS
jgi:hypothetical protein